MAKVTELPPEWWTDRRKRDYYIGETGEVRVVAGSETEWIIQLALINKAAEIAAKQGELN